MEHERAVVRQRKDTVENERVCMNVEVYGPAKSLHARDHSGLALANADPSRAVPVEPCATSRCRSRARIIPHGVPVDPRARY